MLGTVDALVVDASVAVKWHLLDEDHGERANELLTRFSRGELVLLAPEHIRYEVPSAITTATRGSRPRLTLEQGRQAIEEFLALGLTTVSDAALVVAAFHVAHRYAIALYDALYVALAHRVGCTLVTADRRLYERVGHLPSVQWIGH